MRMARVNVSIPDDIVAQAKATGLNISRLATCALAVELDRLAKIASLDAQLAELDAELGPIPEDEARAAKHWVDRLEGFEARRGRPARRSA